MKKKSWKTTEKKVSTSFWGKRSTQKLVKIHNNLESISKDYFFFVVVVSSLHLSFWTAAWVTFTEAGRLQPVLFLAATRFLECFMSITSSLDVFLPLVSLSFSIHILWIESLFLALRASDRVHFWARQWSFAGGRSCFVSKFQIPRVSILMWWRDFFELAAGFDLAPFQKNVTEVVRSSPRPRCLG